MILRRFAAYRESEDKAFEDGLTASPAGWVGSEAGAFSERLEVAGHQVGIVGVNTAWLCMDEDDRHRLSPGFHLLEEALDAVKDCEVRIVLGHHPLDWMHDEQVEALRALFGEHGALYLHGHLHRSRGRQEEGAGRGYLAIQAGACFQARDNEPWRNGLLWAELDLVNKELRLQPRSWQRAQRAWPPDFDAFAEPLRKPGTDWWAFPLPGTRKAKKSRQHTSQSASVAIPRGWQIVDRSFLDARRKALSKADAVLFFDGSVPSWQLALASEEIPRRRVVKRMVAKLSAEPGDRPRVVLLVGPGAEGKSTAVLQTIVALVEQDPERRVLWRDDESCSLTPADVRILPPSKHWLIATDNADLGANDLFAVVKALRSENRADVSLLLSCRDTDWLAYGGRDLPWGSHASFHEQKLSDLTGEDARRIVAAWSRQGDEGLGRLAGKSQKEAIRLLREAAVREAARKEQGAFFGAMLEVRIGGALRAHLRSLLDRLEEREIHPGVTLRDAFAYIAAMHAEQLEFLSRPVLAQALACEPGLLKAKVLGPLGKEAAAVGAGRFILTRHRTIVRTAVEILSETFEWEIDDLYVALAHSASRARIEQGFLPDLDPAQWRFGLPEHFHEAGRQDLAIRIGRALLDADPIHMRTRTSLSKLYRKVGAPEEAVRLFREHLGKMDRSAYHEWGIAEGIAGNPIGSAWLVALSVADQADGPPPDNKDAKLSLASLAASFEKLYEAYYDRVFLEVRSAIGVLGLTLRPIGQTRSYFEKYLRDAQAQGVPEVDADTSFERFEAAVHATGELCTEDDPLAPLLPAFPGALTFNGLRRLLRHAARR